MSTPPVGVEESSIRVPTGLKKPRFRSVPAWVVSQSFEVQATKLDALGETAAAVDELLLPGVDVRVGQISYISTKLKTAKYAT